MVLDSPDLLVTDWSEHRVRKLTQQAPKDGKPAEGTKLDLTVSAAARD